MISTEQTRWIISKLNHQSAVAAAAQAVVDEENRRIAAQASYTVDELLELVDLALDNWREDDDYRATAREFAWQITQLDSRYVLLDGWNFSRPLMLRPADVPDEVTRITGCTCESGSCHHCTCCDRWNGYPSCMWIEEAEEAAKAAELSRGYCPDCAYGAPCGACEF